MKIKTYKSERSGPDGPRGGKRGKAHGIFHMWVDLPEVGDPVSVSSQHVDIQGVVADVRDGSSHEPGEDLPSVGVQIVRQERSLRGSGLLPVEIASLLSPEGVRIIQRAGMETTIAGEIGHQSPSDQWLEHLSVRHVDDEWR